ncbi:Transthyretin-like family-containing protein [Aphelenchoides bicaudatus]|nr:Transthyretin-like family-containing protein [Aphelenchoides bicaudatus]
MASAYTNAQGYFELEGIAHEFLTVDAKINIYHDCDDRIVPCQRKFSIELPSKYVYSGEHPERYYDVGKLEISGKFGDESRDCIH